MITPFFNILEKTNVISLELPAENDKETFEEQYGPEVPPPLGALHSTLTPAPLIDDKTGLLVVSQITIIFVIVTLEELLFSIVTTCDGPTGGSGASLETANFVLSQVWATLIVSGVAAVTGTLVNNVWALCECRVICGSGIIGARGEYRVSTLMITRSPAFTFEMVSELVVQ